MNESKKVKTLKQRYIFGKVYAKAPSFASRGLVLYYTKNHLKANKIQNGSNRNGKPTLLGISVSKKRGNAVARNRTKRIIKEAYRSLYGRVKSGYIVILVARQACVDYKSTDVKRELEILLQKANLFVS